ncbi:MAG: hypothetical protein M1334_02725 [Patescibacteria group bacterium]|nr:hypothetical protein [Patescibacteria group bacterium]
MTNIITLFQGSFDRQNESIQRKLACEFLSKRLNSAVNLAEIELPPTDDSRKADFVYKGELFQVVIPHQDAGEKDILPDSPIRSVEEQRKSFSKIIKGKSGQSAIFGGDYLKILTYTIKEKFDKYGTKGSRDLVLIIECVDIFFEIFDFSIAQSILAEVKRRAENTGVNFKEIWLVKRWIVEDQPAYIRQLKF